MRSKKGRERETKRNDLICLLPESKIQQRFFYSKIRSRVLKCKSLWISAVKQKQFTSQNKLSPWLFCVCESLAPLFQVTSQGEDVCGGWGVGESLLCPTQATRTLEDSRKLRFLKPTHLWLLSESLPLWETRWCSMITGGIIIKGTLFSCLQSG